MSDTVLYILVTWSFVSVLAPISASIWIAVRRRPLGKALIEEMLAGRIPASPLDYPMPWWRPHVKPGRPTWKRMSAECLRYAALEFAYPAAIEGRLPYLQPALRARLLRFEHWRWRTLCSSAMPALAAAVALLVAALVTLW